MFNSRRELLAFGYQLMNSLHSHFSGSSFEKDVYEKEHQSLLVSGGMRFAFRWWGDKPAYIILFKGAKYFYELDLSRVVESEGKYTWHLSRPSHKANKKLLEKFFPWKKTIDPSYRDEMVAQKKKLHSGRAIQKGAFYFIHENNYSELENNFLELIDKVVILHLGIVPPRVRETYDLDDANALEGYQSDKRYLSSKRNQALVQKRKRKDDYTCQACGFQLRINTKYIIECHHTAPLAGGETRVTNIEDLVSLCPTCHRIAHTQNPPLSLDNIQDLRKN
jgi:hypothetical protein